MSDTLAGNAAKRVSAPTVSGSPETSLVYLPLTKTADSQPSAPAIFSRTSGAGLQVRQLPARCKGRKPEPPPNGNQAPPGAPLFDIVNQPS
jgi:hypothetical protein